MPHRAADQWYNRARIRPRPTIPGRAAGTIAIIQFIQQEVAMSADKDRAIRRQKQKRAKEMKRQSRQQQPAGVKPGATKSAVKQKAG